MREQLHLGVQDLSRRWLVEAVPPFELGAPPMKVLTLLALVVIGCGAPTPVDGAACAAGSPPKCSSNSTAMFCESGKWVPFQCDDFGCRDSWTLSDGGPSGDYCHLPKADAGTACPASWPQSSTYCRSLFPDTADPRAFAYSCSAAGWLVETQCFGECKKQQDVAPYTTWVCK